MTATRRVLRAMALAAALALAAGACQMTVDLRTKVNGDGGGVFTVDIQMDSEMLAGLKGLDVDTQGGDAIALLDSFFDCLRGRGWKVGRSEPAGGLRLQAARDFSDPEGFDGVLRSLRCTAGSGERLRIENFFQVELDYGVSRSFLRSSSFFRGTVDLGSDLELDEESKQQLQTVQDLDIVKVNVSADLPGAISITKGDGVVQGGRAVWQPELIQKLEFEGRASSLRVGALLLLALPLLLVIGGGAWWLAGRRKHEPVAAGGIFTESAASSSAPAPGDEQGQP